MKVVEMTLTVNGEEWHYRSTVAPDLWEYPEYRLAIIKQLKAKLIDAATAGLEPKMEVVDMDDREFWTDWAQRELPPRLLGSEITIEAKQ